jgi:N-acylneuraminate cytidylyltransferase
MRVLGLIPARGGSKGVPGKNTRFLLGKSLVERAFETATASGVLDRIVLSTDDPAIGRVAAQLGLEVPFLRPAEFARDDSPMIDCVRHAVTALSQASYRPDAVLLLQPTSPLRRPTHIQEAVQLLPGHDSVCSVVAVPQEVSPHYLMRITPEGFLDFFLPDGATYGRRQDVPRAYRRDGTIYLTRTTLLLDHGSLYGPRCVPMHLPHEESLSIDDDDDWAEAERRLRRRAITTDCSDDRTGG